MELASEQVGVTGGGGTAPVPQDKMTPLLLWITTLATGISVGNLYFCQPILTDMARSFRVPFAQAGLISTWTQLGYVLGLLIFVALGDNVNRRTVIVRLLLAVTVADLAVSFAPGFALLLAASFIVGVFTVVPQLIIPFAASLAHHLKRGSVVGAVVGGLLVGIILSRTVSGLISTSFGWRAVYWFAAVVMFLLAWVLHFTLPSERPAATMNYLQILRSMVKLFRTEPVLRESCLFGALIFGAFSAFWVALGFFLATPPYHYDSAVTGLFGLIGVVGALASTRAGKLADRRAVRPLIGGILVIDVIAFIFLWPLGHQIWAIVIGVNVLNFATQAGQVFNQARVYSIGMHAAGRLNTIYVVCYFMGGTISSAISTYAWGLAGWNGVCGVACILILGALALYVFKRPRPVRDGFVNSTN
jgi:predicted MFS family arabinose efflux permease